MPARKNNNKITIAKIVKFIFTIGVVITVLAMFWQRPESQVSAVATKIYREGVV